MVRVSDSNIFSFGVVKVDSDHVSNAKHRVADGVGYCFRVPFGHRCTHIKIFSDNGDQIAKRDGQRSCMSKNLAEIEFSDEGFTLWGGGRGG